MEFAGASSGAKTFAGNNVGAGWVRFGSPNWTIGGSTDADSNILIGPRVGLFGTVTFTGTLKLNYSHHIYYGGWSQGNNHEWWDLTPTIEHSIIVGGSWPVRGMDGTFRYNLVLGVGGEEGLLWLHTAAANVHHNILRTSSLSSRGMIYGIYGAAGATVRNNTLDGVNQAGNPLVELTSGSYTLNSNLFLNGSSALALGTTTATTDYNGFFHNLGATKYSDGRTPTHDVAGDPHVTGTTAMIPFDVSTVWSRTLTVKTLLAAYRGYYTPTAVVVDTGDTGTFGADNDIGAVGESGNTNVNDLFGTL